MESSTIHGLSYISTAKVFTIFTLLGGGGGFRSKIFSVQYPGIAIFCLMCLAFSLVQPRFCGFVLFVLGLLGLES